jgi:hypothetical protein
MISLIVALVLGTQAAPAYTATGATPFVGGACDGTRVQIVAANGDEFCCISSVWAKCGPYRAIPFPA